MEIFLVQSKKYSFECATIMGSIEGGYLVMYREVVYKVFDKEPGSTIALEDLIT